MQLLEAEHNFVNTVKNINKNILSLRLQLFDVAANNQVSSVLDCYKFKEELLPKWGLKVI